MARRPATRSIGRMKAVLVTRPGGPEVLDVADVPEPEPGPGEVVVDVVAAGVNFMDIYAREGRPPYDQETPFVPGAEGAGIVSAVGPAVTGVTVGDRVAWTGVPQSYAERVVVPADRAVPVPVDLDLHTAAAVMLQGCTAHYLASSTWLVRAGTVAVVHAAAGGVGQLLTQIVRLRGGVVVGTTSGGSKADVARDAGAQHVAGYDDYLAVVRDVTGGAGADVVYDGVGAATFDDSLRALRRRGLLALYGAASGPVPPLDLQRLASLGSLYITRPTLVDYVATRAELVGRTDELFGWIAEGKLRVGVGGTYPFAEARRAHEALAGRRTTGKLLLTP
jgi:NADPH:quinone reductase